MRIGLMLALLGAGSVTAFAATPLTCGQPASGSVSANGTSTTFTFGAQAGDSILIRLIAMTQGVVFNPPVLADPGGGVVKQRLNGFSLESSGYFTYDLATAGTYQYTISGTAVGNYMVVYTPLNRPCTASGALSCGVPSKGMLAPGQLQTYQFSGKNGDQISLHMLQSGGDAGAGLEVIGFDSAAHLQLIGPTLTNALFGSITGMGVSQYKLTSDGTQTLVVAETSGRLNLTYAINEVDLTGPCAATAVSCGSAVDGNVSGPLVTPAYSLNANKGDIYLLRYVSTDNSGSLLANLEFLDAQGNAVTPQSTGDPTASQYTLTAGGAYTILIFDSNGTGTGKFSMSLARLNSPCNAQPVSCGSTTNGQISGAARFASYSLNAQAGDLYLLRLLRTGAGSNFRPRVQIYGSDGSSIQNVATSGLGSVTFSTTNAGAYTLLASDSYDGTQSGAYTFALSRLNRPCGSAVSLTCGTLAAGSITQALQAGNYTYTAAAGDSFTVRLVDTGGSLQTALQVYDTNGQALPVVGGNTKAVDVAGAQGGAYTIMVTDQSSSPQTGSFAVEAISTKGACAVSPPMGQSVSGLVSGPAPFMAYTFAAAQGEPMLLRLASFTPGFTANMDLYDPTGKRLGSSTLRLANAAAASGNYTAVVGASSPRTAGSYAFAWQLLDQPNAAPLSCGQTVAGSLGAGSQFSFYQVNANDGDLVKLVLSRLPATTNAQVELFDPRGASVKSSATEVDQKVSAGTYTVMVSPATASAESGGFAVALQKPNNPCGAMNLTCGQTILQQVTAPGQLDTYTFSGNAGDPVAITVTPRTGAFSPVTELYDASGNLVSGSGAVTTLNTTLAATGQYTLTVHDRSGGNLGSYRVGLQHTNTPCPEDDTQKPTITLLHPTGGEVIAGGTVYQIAWQSDDNTAVTQHVIQLSTDGGQTFGALPGGPGTLSGVTQSYAWTVPAGITPTRTAVIRVTATDKGGNTNAASSDLVTLIGSGFTPNESVTYSYDPLNRIVQASYAGGSTIYYNYDAAGNLIKIVVQ